MKFIDHQELTVGGSTSIEIKFKLSEKGILWALISSSHKSLSKRFLKFWLKGPQYERKPVQSSISPTSLGKKKLCTISFSLYLHKQLLKHTCKKISAPYAYLRKELVVFESNKWFVFWWHLHHKTEEQNCAKTLYFSLQIKRGQNYSFFHKWSKKMVYFLKICLQYIIYKKLILNSLGMNRPS